MKKSARNITILVFILLFAMFLFACKPESTAYTVSFEANGGTAVESQQTRYISDMPLSEKSGHIFEGWYTAADFSGKAVTFPYEVVQDCTLHAKWITEAEGNAELTYALDSENNTYSVTGYNGGSHIVVIPPTYENKPVVAIADGAFNGCHTVTKISIPASVSSIGKAFSRCNNLFEISVKETNPGYKSIDGVLYSFDVSRLVSYPPAKQGESFNVPESVTKIEDSALRFCLSLESVLISKNVTEIEKNFEGCYSLKKIEVDTSNAVYKSIDGVLFSKDAKTLIRYPLDYVDKDYAIPEGTDTIGAHSFDGSEIQTLQLAASIVEFAYIEDCKKLTAFSVHADNQYYSSIGGALFTKDGATLLQYPQSKAGAPYKNEGDEREYYSYHLPEGVTKINSRAFNACQNLNKIFMPSSLTEIAPYAFVNPEGQFALKEIVFVAGSSLKEIGEAAFMDIPLELIKLTALLPPTVGKDAFDVEKDKLKIFVPTETKDLYDNSVWNNIGTLADGGAEQTFTVKFFTNGGNDIADIKKSYIADPVIPQKENSVFGGWFFDNATFLQPAEFPMVLTENVSLYAKWYSAAAGTAGLQFNLNTDSQTYVISGYSGAASVVEVPPTYNNKLVAAIGTGAFAGKTHITSVTLPETIMEIREGAFEGAYNAVMRLESVVFQGARLKSIANYAFRYCRKLTDIVLPQGLETIGNGVFDNCYMLKNIAIPRTVRTMGNGVFSNCPQLEEITVEASSQYFASESGVLYDKAMQKLIRYPSGNKNDNFEIPGSVINVENEAFHSAVYLRQLDLNNVQNIGSRAFWFSSLTSIAIPDTITEFSPSVLRNTPLRSITLGANIAQIEDYFHALDELEEITVAVTNENFCSVGGVLYSADKKTLLRFPSAKIAEFALPPQVETIADKAFLNTKIRSIALSENLRTIGANAFENAAIESITLNGGLAQIEEGAFMSSALRAVFLSSNAYPEIGENVFAGADVRIYAPQAILPELAAAGWAAEDKIFENAAVIDGFQLILLDNYYKVLKVLSLAAEITIPQEISGIEVRQIGRMAFSDAVRRINIPSTVKRLDSYAFAGCKSLTTLVFEDSLEIGANAFQDCGMLTNIVFGGGAPVINGVLPDFFRLNVFVPPSEDYSATDFAAYNILTTDNIDGDWAFVENGASVWVVAYLGYDSDITIPPTLGGKSVTAVCEYTLNPNISKVTVSGGIAEIKENAFSAQPYGAMSLKEIIFEGATPVVIGENAFYGLPIEEITLPSGLTSIEGSSFRHNERLRNIYISSENETFSAIDGVLYDKTAETIVRYPQAKLGYEYSLPNTVTAIGCYAFAQTELIAVRLSANTLTIQSYAFEDSGILDIDLPDGFLVLEPYALKSCERIMTISLPPSLTSFPSTAVLDCSSLSVIYAPPHSQEYSAADGVLFDKDGTTLISYPAGKKGAYTIPESVTSIAPYAFFGSRLENITIPDTVTQIGEYAFAFSQSLKTIDMSNAKVLPEGMLKGCTKLTSITADAAEEIAPYFAQDCVLLRAFDFSSALRTIGEKAFSGCLALTQIIIQSAGLESVGDFAFAGCAALNNFEMPAHTLIGESILKGATGVTEMKISMKYTLPYIFGANNGALALRRVTVFGSAYIPEEYFMNCVNLEYVSISPSVTVVKRSAFENCSSLAEVEFAGQSALTHIEEWAFRSCNILAKLRIINETPPTVDASAFTTINQTKLPLLKVYVPAAYVDAYAQSWQVNVIAIS
jgi:uncharacterized repeat protein (TIGR02543 family)